MELYLLVLSKRKHFKLRLHCEKVSVFGVILVCIFPGFSHFRTEYREIRSIYLYLVGMHENVGNMWTGITANTNNFYTVLELSMNGLHELGYVYSPYLSKFSVNNRHF